ncbi:hypothetical protein Tco_1370905 [Tanacetum coccineum]
MIDCLSIVETDKVNHAVETDIVTLMVEIKSFGMSSDEFDKEIRSSDGLQPKQADLSCVHALNELYLQEIHVVPKTKKTPDAPIIEDWVSNCEEDEIMSKVSFEPSELKIVIYHDKKMGQKPVLNKGKKGTGERESKPVWNDAMRTNHQNFSNNRRNFSPKAVLTKSGDKYRTLCKCLNQAEKDKLASVIRSKMEFNKAGDGQSANAGIYQGDPQVSLKDTGIFDSGCSRHMTGNKSFLTNYQEYDGGFVAFAGSSKGGKISGKGTIRTGNLNVEDTECLIHSPDFKLPDENQVMLKIRRKDNMYSFDLKNIAPSKDLTCLISKATNDV